MKIEHTPGPWVIDSDGDGKANAIVTSTHLASLDDDICEVYGGNMDGADIRQANARLIAASPDLLRACYQALAAMRDLAEQAGDVPEWNTGGDAYEACNALRAAIAKAEGKVR